MADVGPDVSYYMPPEGPEYTLLECEGIECHKTISVPLHEEEYRAGQHGWWPFEGNHWICPECRAIDATGNMVGAALADSPGFITGMLYDVRFDGMVLTTWNATMAQYSADLVCEGETVPVWGYTHDCRDMISWRLAPHPTKRSY